MDSKVYVVAADYDDIGGQSPVRWNDSRCLVLVRADLAALLAGPVPLVAGDAHTDVGRPLRSSSLTAAGILVRGNHTTGT